MSNTQPLTAGLRLAIRQSGESYYAIARATRLDKSALGRFMARKQSLRLDMADRLAAHLGLMLLKKDK